MILEFITIVTIITIITIYLEVPELLEPTRISFDVAYDPVIVLYCSWEITMCIFNPIETCHPIFG